MMKSQRGDTEKVNRIEEGKKIGIDKVIKCNGFINNSLKYQIQNNVILLFKVRKNVIQGFPKLLTIRQWYYQNVLYVVVNSQVLFKKIEASGILTNLDLMALINRTRYLVISCFKIIKWKKQSINVYYLEINLCLKCI